MFRHRDYIPKVAPLARCMIQSSGDDSYQRTKLRRCSESQHPNCISWSGAGHGFNGNTKVFQALSEGLPGWIKHHR